jgi:hypothetical protein
VTFGSSDARMGTRVEECGGERIDPIAGSERASFVPQRAAFILRARTDAFVCSTSFCLERHARRAAEAMAQRVSALADGDLFGPVGRQDEVPGCAAIRMVVPAGITELPVLDGPGAARGAQAAVTKAMADPSQ